MTTTSKEEIAILTQEERDRIAPVVRQLALDAYIDACRRYEQNYIFAEEARAAADEYRLKMFASEAEPSPEHLTIFEHFYMGFIQGITLQDRFDEIKRAKAS